MRTLLRRLSVLLRRDRFDREIDEELRFHLDMKARDLADASDGRLADVDAQAAARRQVGNPLRLRESAREPWLLTTIETAAQDVRHALRLLRREPTFTLASLATLALGIGLTTTIFSVAYGVLWRPLPYPEPDRLVLVQSALEKPTGIQRFYSWSPDGYLRLQDADVLDGLAAYTGVSPQLTGQREPLQLEGMEVTPNFFAVLGATPALGRTFLTGSAAGDDDGSVVISDRLWRSALQGASDAIGRTMILDGAPRTVIGVMSPDFAYRAFSAFGPRLPSDVWIPNRWADGGGRNAFLTLLGRLKAGIGPEQAQARLTAIVRASSGDVPSAGPNRTVAGVVRLHDEMVAPIRQLLLILLGAVAFVLLIACVNVANLQMARLSARRVELSVRAALGAGRRRLVRQLSTEALVLACAGGALGVLLAKAAFSLALPLVPVSAVTRSEGIALHREALVFCVVVSMLVSIVIGVLPALRIGRLDDGRALHGGASRTSTDRHGERLRALLVTSQIALTLVLLIGAGLLAHSFVRLMQVTPGFQSSNVQTVTVTIPDRLMTLRLAVGSDGVRRAGGGEEEQQSAQTRAFARDVLEGIRRLPGVESASVTNSMPFGSPFFIRGDFDVEGQPKPKLYVGKPKIEPGYFKTMGIPVLRGRDFSERDDAFAPKVAIVSESVAREIWPTGDALGQRLRLGGETWLTVVGVAADVRQFGLDEPTQPMVYVPFQQEASPFFLQVVSFAVRATTPATAIAEGVRAEIRRAAPDLPVAGIGTMDEFVSKSVAQPRFRMALLGLFAVSATLIAICGIYGLMAYAVAQRRREIGVRMALGADQHQVLRLVLGRALRVVGVGVVLGVLGSLAATRLLRTFLFGVTPGDPLAFGVVTLALVAVGMLAAWVPARRAGRVDPVAALRAE